MPSHGRQKIFNSDFVLRSLNHRFHKSRFSVVEQSFSLIPRYIRWTSVFGDPVWRSLNDHLQRSYLRNVERSRFKYPFFRSLTDRFKCYYFVGLLNDSLKRSRFRIDESSFWTTLFVSICPIVSTIPFVDGWAIVFNNAGWGWLNDRLHRSLFMVVERSFQRFCFSVVERPSSTIP